MATLINIKWWFEEEDEFKELPFEARQDIENRVEQRIINMRADGYTSGELCESYNEIEFYGWWEYRQTKE